MEQDSYRPEYIFDIASNIQNQLEKSIRDINDVHQRAHVLSINARIEAARSGQHGVGFKIVAQEFGELNDEIRSISRALGINIQNEAQRLLGVSDRMAKQVRGQRLSQIGLSIMDVIDRNLYERTCDVRWWATDSSVLDTLKLTDNITEKYVSKRLGEILDSYTVYHDILLADINGKVVANGRPEKFKNKGAYVDNKKWFQDACATPNMQYYSFEETHKNKLVNDHRVLIYSCRVDDENNKQVGVLGIFFNWDGLFDAVIHRVISIDLQDDISVMKISTKVSIINETGIVLSSTSSKTAGSRFEYNRLNEILTNKTMGHHINQSDKNIHIIAYGYSPGFETYSTGWFCIIEQII